MEKFKAILTKVKGWFREDGLQRLVVSTLILVALGWIRPFWIPVLVTILIGAGKEVYDYFHQETHSAEWHDFICDLIGIAFGCLFVLLNSLA